MHFFRIGSMPGSILFGAVLDKSCILWEEKCDNSGSCLYYNNYHMAMYMLGICVLNKLLSSIFSFLAWRLYKTRPIDGNNGNLGLDGNLANGSVNQAYVITGSESNDK